MDNQEKMISGQVRNLAQRRAEFAYHRLKKVTEWSDEKKKKEFKSHVKDVPMMIKTNGLAAAFAFVYSKSGGANSNAENDYKAIEEITRDWLVEEQKLLGSGENTFHEALLTLSQFQYRLVTKEILALFTWLKRYADALLKD